MTTPVSRTPLAILAIAVIAFVLLNLRIGFHTDDLKIISDASDLSYRDLWTTPFLDRFYRPVVVTLVRVSIDSFGMTVLPIRIAQGVLVTACVYVLVTMLKERVDPTARYFAGIYLIASPLTFVSVSLFAVGIGDLIVGLLFLLVVRISLQTNDRSLGRSAWSLVAYSIVALLSKESGVLVAAYSTIECLRRKHWLAAVSIGGSVLGYLAFRSTFLSRSSFDFPTGYFFQMYSIDELNQEFGHSPGRIHAYNVIANFANSVLGFPEKGQLRLSVIAPIAVPTTALTTMIIVRYLTIRKCWKTLAPLVAVLPVNSLIGYGYVRSRIMFVGAFAMAVLVQFALSDLLVSRDRILRIPGRAIALLIIVLWLCLLAYTLTRLPLQAAAASTFEKM